MNTWHHFSMLCALIYKGVPTNWIPYLTAISIGSWLGTLCTWLFTDWTIVFSMTMFIVSTALLVVYRIAVFVVMMRINKIERKLK